MIRIATARNYALVAMLMTSGALMTMDNSTLSTSVAASDDSNDSQEYSYSTGWVSNKAAKSQDFAVKMGVRKQLDKVFDKDAVFETTIKGVPYRVLSKTTLSRSAVDATKSLACTQDPGEAAKELLISAAASEIVELLGVATTHSLNLAGSAANMLGIQLFDNFRENHPDIANGTWAVVSHVAHMSTKKEIRKKMN